MGLAGWRATVLSPAPLTAPATLSAPLRERVSFRDPSELSEADALARADVVVLASEGIRVAPGTLVRAIGAGAVPVVSRLEAYEELLGHDSYGLEFEPGDAVTLGYQLARLVSEPELRRGLAAQRATPAREALLGARGRRARGDLWGARFAPP